MSEAAFVRDLTFPIFTNFLLKVSKRIEDVQERMYIKYIFMLCSTSIFTHRIKEKSYERKKSTMG